MTGDAAATQTTSGAADHTTHSTAPSEPPNCGASVGTEGSSLRTADVDGGPPAALGGGLEKTASPLPDRSPMPTPTAAAARAKSAPSTTGRRDAGGDHRSAPGTDASRS